MDTETSQRNIIKNGPHTTEVINVLMSEIKSVASLQSVSDKAYQIIVRSVDPKSDHSEHSNDGLLYGLIQSGKTSIITISAAMAADNGFQCIVILTSDINLLYDQTLERIRKALRGLPVLGKNDWKDAVRFERYLKSPPVVIVCSKNGSKLNSLLDALKKANVKGLSALIIDDEADQASLNTFTSKATGEISRINSAITNFRSYFKVNTYLQVTATPQALFLQKPSHLYRPAFTVLSQPGDGYVGGDVFFGPNSKLLRYVDLNEIDNLRASHQPTPTGVVPNGLKEALYIFLVAATIKLIQKPGDGYAFLCHVSMNKRDHEYIVNLMDKFKEETLNTLKDLSSKQYGMVVKDLQNAYDDISQDNIGLPDFDKVLEKIKFYLSGTNVKLINASSNEEIKLDSVYNIFVGGNKLGRGVTIKNLLVSYYGRNPKKPNSDTVLQHARMYGYRLDHLGMTRLFLPEKLAEHFRLIHQMENALRDLVAKYPTGEFEGLYISAPLRATRTNILDPNSLGMYIAGGSYNPSYPLRTKEMMKNTEWLDSKLSGYDENSSGKEVTVDSIVALLEKCIPDPKCGCELWDSKIIKVALEKIKTLRGNKAYLVVRRNRNLNQPRRETQGILSGGEEALAPTDAPALFLFRQNANAKNETEVWWPQLRFPDGNYVLAFSFDW